MGNKLKNIGLIGLGMVAGVAASLQFSAHAQKGGETPLPLDELRQLADVFALIKSDYVEPVPDKKLLSEAIAGMAPLAAIATKEMVNAAFETGLAQGIVFERRLFHGLFGTEDQKEGMSAFVDKRKADWKGR